MPAKNYCLLNEWRRKEGMYLSCRTRQNSVWSEWLECLLEASLPFSRGIFWSAFLMLRLSHWLAGLQSFHAHWFRSWWSGFRNHVFAAGTGHRMAPTASVLRAELRFGPAHCCVYRVKNCAWPTQKCLVNKWRKQQMSIEEEAGALNPPSKVIWNKCSPPHRPSMFKHEPSLSGGEEALTPGKGEGQP